VKGARFGELVELTFEEQDMLDGKQGRSARKAMEILAALGAIYEAETMLPVTSVQIAGVSYDNLGEAGLQWLDDMAQGGGQARVLTTLNPAGMDLDNWQALGIDAEFARQQRRVIEAFAHMGVITNCSCTPYLSGILPHYGEHIAWAESSAVCYANSVLGARTNREGGPSALAAALTGRTPAYGYHLDENRRPSLTVDVQAQTWETYQFGALGYLIGKHLEAQNLYPVPFISGVKSATLESLKSFCASLATYGGAALFHMQGITPEAALYNPPRETLQISQFDVEQAAAAMSDAAPDEIDFVSLGCPHLSIAEIAHLAALLQGQQVRKEFWITTSRPVKHLSDRMGYTQTIEATGAVFAVDTCCVVAPIRGRFTGLATDSAKACYYAASKNGLKTLFLSFDEVVKEALR
jgi:predicted aconitase